MATFKQTTGQEIQEAFEEFDRKNPHVYELFKQYLRDVYNAKGPNAKTSAKLIINRIRWEVYLNTDSNDEFQVNDAFTSRYARKFAEEHPKWAHLLNFKKLRSK